jgi:hypothetical protein
VPYVCWLHPYARRTTARKKPARLLEWADRLLHAIAPSSLRTSIDSMVAQLYAPGGGLTPHVDDKLSWGLSLSLGSDAEFSCLPAGKPAQRVTLRSGDIVAAEFGQLVHAVETSARPPPRWWAEVETFGPRVRCNVLFRMAITAQRQREICEERAHTVHGMGVAELVRRTGRDEAWFLKFLTQLDEPSIQKLAASGAKIPVC